MHGILAAFNEYRSNADGADIRYKMGQKAKNGGTLGRAKVDLNVRDHSLGREVRTIAVDPDRAPYTTLAFELFATGDYTLPRLVRALAERGLRTRGDGRNPSAPVSHSHLSAILRDRYYLGYVNYHGEEFRGRHEPLVTSELFAREQAVLDSHSGSGERTRNHRHYLKGTLWYGPALSAAASHA